MATLNGIDGKYKTHRHYNHWRVTFYATDQTTPGTAGYMFIKHVADFHNYEDAIRETYRLNGWKQPTTIRKPY